MTMNQKMVKICMYILVKCSNKFTYLPLPLFLPKNFALRTYRVLERIDRSLIGYDDIDGIVIG